MPGPNNNNQTPQQLYAGQPTRGGRGRAHRPVAPSRLQTALQVAVVVLTVGVAVFAILSANGVL